MLKLRELNDKDMTTINVWRKGQELIDNLGAPFRYIGLEVDQRWYEEYMNNRNSAVRCAIVDETDSILGLVSLTNIDMLNQSAEFHIMIGDRATGEKKLQHLQLKQCYIMHLIT